MQLMPPFCLVPAPFFTLSLFLTHLLSVPVKWMEVASPALRSFLMRFCGLCVLILWCIVQSFPSTIDRSCYRQNQAGESWPRLLWTESKPRMDTTMFSTLAPVLCEEWIPFMLNQNDICDSLQKCVVCMLLCTLGCTEILDVAFWLHKVIY